MPPVKTSASVLSVLARFEQTIEQNNASGVASGMYLTKLASSSRDKASSKSRNRTATSSLSSSQHSTSRSTSSSKRPANEKYRTSTRLSKVSTGVRDGSGKREFDESKVPNKSDLRDTSEDRGWNASTDTRAAKSFDASFSSLLHDDESSVSDMSQETFGFDEFAFDDPFMPTGSKDQEFNPFGLEEVTTADQSPEPESIKKQRPVKEKRGIGRLGNRTTKAKLDVKAARKSNEKPLDDNVGDGESERNHEDIEISNCNRDDENEDGFSLTYVSNRDGKIPINRAGTVLQESSSHRRSNKCLDASSNHSKNKSPLRQKKYHRQNSLSKNVSPRLSESSNNRYLKNKTSNLETSTHDRYESPSRQERISSHQQRKSKDTDSKHDRNDGQRELSSRRDKTESTSHRRRHVSPPQEKENARVTKTSSIESDSLHSRNKVTSQHDSTTRRNKHLSLDTKSTHARKFTNTLNPTSAQSRFFGGDQPLSNSKVKVRSKADKAPSDPRRNVAQNSDGLDSTSDHSKHSSNSRRSTTSKMSSNSLLSSNSNVGSTRSLSFNQSRENYASRKPQLVSRSGRNF
jgi:hypothetical protein